MPKLGDPTDFSYRINKVTKVVDGDTIDVIMDMGFDIMYKSRVRLFGIDTPESRTRNLDEKKRGLLAKKYFREPPSITFSSLHESTLVSGGRRSRPEACSPQLAGPQGLGW